MKVVISANGREMDGPASPVFGRCPYYIFIDSETGSFEALANPAMNAPGGAGIKAAQYISEQHAEILISGSVGPNAFEVLDPADIRVFKFEAGSVRDAFEAWQAGRLEMFRGANVAEHAGMNTRTPEMDPEEDLSALQVMAKELRGRIAELTEKIDELERNQN